MSREKQEFAKERTGKFIQEFARLINVLEKNLDTKCSFVDTDDKLLTVMFDVKDKVYVRLSVHGIRVYATNYDEMMEFEGNGVWVLYSKVQSLIEKIRDLHS